jgi:succinoglycan biosynthesis protein ExoL
MEKPLRVLYLAHDLSNANVAKRVAMLVDGGATVSLAGFRRTTEPVTLVAGSPAVNFGQTFNAGFLHRIVSVVRVIVFFGNKKKLFAETDVILARNLEMLAIAVRLRSILGNTVPVIYESIDMHRLLLRSDLVGKSFRALEGWLSRRASALITSSPAFIAEYFNKRSNVRLPARLVENKLYPVPANIEMPARTPGPAWKIGWFGVIRCRKSLDILLELVKRSSGTVEVIIRGLPALDQFDDFHKSTNSVPGLRFEGAYKNPDDLSAIYHEVHFAWAIDMFEEGLNSSWLLPNRIYEGGLFGAVPIALATVETGRTLDRMGIGVTMGSLDVDALVSFFNQLTATGYHALEERVRAMPVSAWTFSKQDCEDLVEFLASFAEKVR